MNKDRFEEKSYWMTTQEYHPGPALEGDLDVDVAIVGGGFTGLSTAYHLKKESPGLRIAIFESEFIGFGASGRNGGFNMTLFGLTLGITAIRFGKARACEAHHYMERAVDLLQNLVSELNLDCDYEHPGFLRVATSEKYRKRLLHEIELANKLGLNGIEWLDQEETRTQVNSPGYLGAWSEPRCGILNPAKLAWAWAGVLRKSGIEIYEHTPMTAIAYEGSRIRITTPGGTVHADKAVLATNAWSHLIHQTKSKQTPVWTHMVLTEPLTDEQMKSIGWNGRQGIEDARNLVHYYRLTADNRLAMGGRDVSLPAGRSMDHDLNESVFQGLRKDVTDIFPTLKDVHFSHAWGGPVSVTMDMAPALGYLGDKRIIYSLGCVGHGVSLTHLNGRTISDLILEKKTDLTDTFFVNRRIIPWPPGFLRSGIIHLIRGYLRLEDSIYD